MKSVPPMNHASAKRKQYCLRFAYTRCWQQQNHFFGPGTSEKFSTSNSGLGLGKK